MTAPTTQYVVLLPGDEAAWAAATEDERQATYAQHREFAQRLEERGHRVTGGASSRTPARRRCCAPLPTEPTP